MKKRFQLPLFALIFFAVSGAHGQSIFTWSPNPTSSLLSLSSNWIEGNAPPTSDANIQLVFGKSDIGFINIDRSALQVHSLVFTGSYNSYHFVSPDGADLIIGPGGVSVPASGNATVVSDSSIFIGLAGDQTWDIVGRLTVRGMIGDASDFTSALIKSGTGTLRLEAENNFSGLRVDAGTLEISTSSQHEGGFIYVSPVGLGDLTLADNTVLRSTGQDVQLHNNIVLGNHVTLDSGDFDSLQLAGTVTVGNANTTIQVAGEQPVLFTSTIDGPTDTNLTFTSTPGRFGGAGFADVFSDNIKKLTADRAALFFFADVPETITLHATNNGYISAAAPENPDRPVPSPAALLERIASPSTFAGTFGFDTHPDSELLHTFTDPLDFSAFKHASFRIGSHSDAIISGAITPVDLGSTSLYPFGGGSGHLVVSSNLADLEGRPASILVSTPSGNSPQYVVLRGNNTTTGTYTLDNVAAHVAVENSIAVLDSANALPGGASGKFAFGSDSPAYIGATEAAFADFNTFLSHLAPGGHNASSILGIDSHDAFNAVLTQGVDSDDYEPRHVSQEIDLRSFNSIYLGTASDVVLAGTVHAPSNGILKLTAVDDGLLRVAAPFGSNVASVEIGYTAGPAAPEFGDGRIEMIAAQTYTGGTTLRSGTLTIAGSSVLDHNTSTLLAGPIGTGTLTVESGASDAILAANDYYVPLYNNIHLNANLQLGSIGYYDGDYGYLDYNRLNLHGDISGSGSLRIFGDVELYGNNTYTGGTVLFSSLYLGSANALGAGTVRVENFSGYHASLSTWGDLTLSNPISLAGHLTASNYGGTLTFAGNITLENPVVLSFYGEKAHITGNISGSHTLMVENGGQSPLWLSGTNTYTGGTQLGSGSIVFASASAIPSSGLIRSVYSGYVGAAFNTNIQSDFLNRFDKPASNGSIGFDTPNLNSPIVISENLDLSGFSLATRLGTSTAATLTGNITPAGGSTDPYQFGGGGGTLTVTSNLSGGRGINVVSPFDAPLTLVLQGDNTHASGAHAHTSFVRFDSANALPSSGSLYAADYGYIGYTENVSGLTPNAFMTRWATAGPNAIVGFDSANVSSPRSISDPISLVFNSSFNASTYIGTSTRVKLAGSLTPFDTTLRLTGVSTGNLEIDSVIASPQVTNVVIGTPIAEISGKAAVTLNKANTYTGGTDLLSSHLILGNASALGTGTLRVGSDDSRLSVNQAAGLTIANDVYTGASYHELTLDGEKPFTLSGEISGQGSLVKTGNATVTLSGDNSDLRGEIAIEKGKLVFEGNTSAGTGGLSFWSEFGIAEFLGDAPAIGPISSYYAENQIVLKENSALTVSLAGSGGIVPHLLADSIIESGSSSIFYGSIHGTGASVTYSTAPETQASLWLYGASDYTGGTTINSGVTVVANHNNALGTTGTITVNGGSLSTGSGVTLASTAARPIVFTAGSIGGSGTISFHSSLVVTNQLALTPGNSIGKLTLQFDSAAQLVLNSGGTYRWELADATGSAGTGWDFIDVAGNVDIAALGGASGVFNLSLHTIDAAGESGYAANFNPDASYSWAILTATSITNFDPAKFNLFADSTTFLNATAGGTFSLSLENNTLLLNFTPVPEPSTWALMITGLAAIAFTALRRKRS